MKKKIEEKVYGPRFELVIQMRDHKGNLTGKTKSFTTDHAEDLDQFWLKNNTQKNKEKYENKRNKNKRFLEKLQEEMQKIDKDEQAYKTLGIIYNVLIKIYNEA